MMSTISERGQRLQPVAEQLRQAKEENNWTWMYDLLHEAYNMGQSDGFDKALGLW